MAYMLFPHYMPRPGVLLDSPFNDSGSLSSGVPTVEAALWQYSSDQLTYPYLTSCWQYYMVYTMFRLTCISQGITARALRGTSRACAIESSINSSLAYKALELLSSVGQQQAQDSLHIPMLSLRAGALLSDLKKFMQVFHTAD